MKLKKSSLLIAIIGALTVGACSPAPNKNSSNSEYSVYSLDDSSTESEPKSSSESISSPESSSESLAPSSSSEKRDSSSSSEEKYSIPKEGYFKRNITVQLEPGLRKNGDSTPYNLSFAYDDEYFLSDNTVYNKHLSMLSFAVTLATAKKEKGMSFFNGIGFKDIIPYSYDVPTTADTMGYFIAHRKIDDFELISIGFRGFNYGNEWANNFKIGLTTNHQGFEERASQVFVDLVSYIKNYCSNGKIKLWINGYSRGGAVANSFINYISHISSFAVGPSDIYVYTFEAPASIGEHYDTACPYVHNVTNDADLITFIPPQSYGLRRFGIDHQIYDSNISTLMKEFDPAVDIPDFKEVSSFEPPVMNDIEFRAKVINLVFNRPELANDVAANTREQYVNNYQDGLGAMIGYIFSLSEATRSALLKDLSDLGLGALSILGDSTGESFANFLKTYLDKDNVQYSEETFVSECAVMVKGIQNLFFVLLLGYVSGELTEDLTRLIDMHFPETTYVLLLNAHKSME